MFEPFSQSSPGPTVACGAGGGACASQATQPKLMPGQQVIGLMNLMHSNESAKIISVIPWKMCSAMILCCNFSCPPTCPSPPVSSPSPSSSSSSSSSFFFMLCCQLHFSLLPVLLLLFHMCLLPMFSCVFLSCPFFSTCSDFFSCILLFCLYLFPSLFLFLSFLSQTHPLDDLTPAPAQARAEDQAPRVFVPG